MASEIWKKRQRKRMVYLLVTLMAASICLIDGPSEVQAIMGGGGGGSSLDDFVQTNYGCLQGQLSPNNEIDIFKMNTPHFIGLNYSLNLQLTAEDTSILQGLATDLELYEPSQISVYQLANDVCQPMTRQLEIELLTTPQFSACTYTPQNQQSQGTCVKFNELKLNADKLGGLKIEGTNTAAYPQYQLQVKVKEIEIDNNNNNQVVKELQGIVTLKIKENQCDFTYTNGNPWSIELTQLPGQWKNYECQDFIQMDANKCTNSLFYCEYHIAGNQVNEWIGMNYEMTGFELDRSDQFVGKQFWVVPNIGYTLIGQNGEDSQQLNHYLPNINVTYTVTEPEPMITCTQTQTALISNIELTYETPAELEQPVWHELQFTDLIALSPQGDCTYVDSQLCADQACTSSETVNATEISIESAAQKVKINKGILIDTTTVYLKTTAQSGVETINQFQFTSELTYTVNEQIQQCNYTLPQGEQVSVSTTFKEDSWYETAISDYIKLSSNNENDCLLTLYWLQEDPADSESLIAYDDDEIHVDFINKKLRISRCIEQATTKTVWLFAYFEQNPVQIYVYGVQLTYSVVEVPPRQCNYTFPEGKVVSIVEHQVIGGSLLAEKPLTDYVTLSSNNPNDCSSTTYYYLCSDELCENYLNDDNAQINLNNGNIQIQRGNPISQKKVWLEVYYFQNECQYYFDTIEIDYQVVAAPPRKCNYTFPLGLDVQIEEQIVIGDNSWALKPITDYITLSSNNPNDCTTTTNSLFSDSSCQNTQDVNNTQIKLSSDNSNIIEVWRGDPYSQQTVWLQAKYVQNQYQTYTDEIKITYSVILPSQKCKYTYPVGNDVTIEEQLEVDQWADKPITDYIKLSSNNPDDCKTTEFKLCNNTCESELVVNNTQIQISNDNSKLNIWRGNPYTEQTVWFQATYVQNVYQTFTYGISITYSVKEQPQKCKYSKPQGDLVTISLLVDEGKWHESLLTNYFKLTSSNANDCTTTQLMLCGDPTCQSTSKGVNSTQIHLSPDQTKLLVWQGELMTQQRVWLYAKDVQNVFQTYTYSIEITYSVSLHQQACYFSYPQGQKVKIELDEAVEEEPWYKRARNEFIRITGSSDCANTQFRLCDDIDCQSIAGINSSQIQLSTDESTLQVWRGSPQAPRTVWLQSRYVQNAFQIYTYQVEITYQVTACEVYELKLESFEGPVCTVQSISSSPWSYQITMGSQERFELSFNAQIKQQNFCAKEVSRATVTLTQSNNPKAPANQKTLPLFFRFNQFANLFSVYEPLNVTESNEWAGEYSFSVKYYLIDDESIELKVLDFKLKVLPGEVIDISTTLNQSSTNQTNSTDGNNSTSTNNSTANQTDSNNSTAIEEKDDEVEQSDETSTQSENPSVQTNGSPNSSQGPNNLNVGISQQVSDPGAFQSGIQIDNQQDTNVIPDQEDEDVEVPQEVRLRIGQVSAKGLVNIEFNQPLVIPSLDLNATNQKRVLLQAGEIFMEKRELQEQKINVKDVFDIKVGTYKQLTNQGQDEEEQVKFDPHIQKWDALGLVVDMGFENPLELSRISSGSSGHSVMFEIKDTSFFVSQLSGVQLIEEHVSKGLINVIPRQLPKDVSEEDIQSQAKAQETILTIIVIFSAVFMKACGEKLINLLLAIQIISYINLFRVDFPAALEIYIKALRKIAEFDVLKTDEIKKWAQNKGYFGEISDKSKAQQIAEQQYSSAGFQSFNPLQNVFGFLVILVMFLIVVAFIIILAIFKPVREKVKHVLNEIKKKMIWSGVIKSVMVTYVKNFVTFYLACRLLMDHDKSQPYDKGVIATVVLLGIPLFLFPIWSWIFLICNKSKLRQKYIYDKFGGLYSNMKLNFAVHSTSILLYPTVFTLRRASFVVAGVMDFEVEGSYFNIFVIVWLSIIYWSWLGHVQPFQSKKILRIEIFNEMSLLFLCYHLFCFTDLTDLQSQNGMIMDSFLVTIFAIIAVNLVMLIQDIITSIRNWYLRKYRKDQLAKRAPSYMSFEINMARDLHTERQRVAEAIFQARIEREKAETLSHHYTRKPKKKNKKDLQFEREMQEIQVDPQFYDREYRRNKYIIQQRIRHAFLGKRSGQDSGSGRSDETSDVTGVNEFGIKSEIELIDHTSQNQKVINLDPSNDTNQQIQQSDDIESQDHASLKKRKKSQRKKKSKDMSQTNIVEIKKEKDNNNPHDDKSLNTIMEVSEEILSDGDLDLEQK